MLFLASKTDELFENIDGIEYKSRYQVPFGQLTLWRKQLLGSRQHQKSVEKYTKTGEKFISSLGDVGYLPIRCSSLACDAEARHGCHVKFSDHRKKKQLIAPLCPACNARLDSFFLKPLTPLLLLGSASSKSPKNQYFTECRIRFLHHTITVNLPTPSKNI